MPFDAICLAGVPTEKHTMAEGETFECDYDKNPTSLYEAIEERAWVAGLNFFKTGQWEKGIFFAPVTDPITPSRQARTWVTRFEDQDGKVRWSQLPIHAAIIFGAPFQFIQELIKIFPQGVKCTDDQHMLPLHLAFKFGAEDTVVACLLEAFPQSIFTKDIRGRLPTEVEGSRKERSKIVEQVIAVMAKTMTKRHGENLGKTVAELQDDLALQNNLNAELEHEKQVLQKSYKKAQEEINALHSKVHELVKEVETGREQLALQGSYKKAQDEIKMLQSKAEELNMVIGSRAGRDNHELNLQRQREEDQEAERSRSRPQARKEEETASDVAVNDDEHSQEEVHEVKPRKVTGSKQTSRGSSVRNKSRQPVVVHVGGAKANKTRMTSVSVTDSSTVSTAGSKGGRRGFFKRGYTAKE